MQEEQIIRDEAQSFFEDYLNLGAHGNNGIQTFHKVKKRLNDFYTPSNKAIFLDEIQTIAEKDLQEHRVKFHGGNAKADCNHEIQAERFAFYIRQELGELPLVAHSKNANSSGNIRDGVFVSYSRENVEYRIAISKHFAPFKNEIKYWDDSKIQPGQKWEEELEKAIKNAKVAILLLSSDFLASDFITKKELPPLLKAAEDDGATILIVILSPCGFQFIPELKDYQTFNKPESPVSDMTFTQRESLWVNLVDQTRRLLEL